MKLNILLILIYIFFSTQKLIKNGVYNIKTNNYYLYYNKRKLFLSETFKHPNTFFRINKIYNALENTFYNVEEIYTKYKLSLLENKELIFNTKKDNLQSWNFIKIEEDKYIIKNNVDCYLVINNSKIVCDYISIQKATQFTIIKIYSEVDERKNIYYHKLINEEPIDILIKYIDLRDPNLHRNGIHQIEKDYDNEELRYSIRSILINIPWVRKIFILMPNEKVRYFKDYNYIKEKIIYVKDKELLGYESSNSLAFQYRLWKMKKFGISDNIIVMDDDYFINNKLEKTDFFYVKNGKVFPSIITSNFLKIDRISVQNNCEVYEAKAKMSKEEQNNDIFNYSKYLTFLFVLNLFNISLNESIFIPKFTHNAIPVNLNDIKEIYNLIYKSKYKYTTLDSKYREIENLQFQTLVLSYTFVKYKRKVKNISYKFIFLNNSISPNYKYSLLCINKGPGNYTYINFFKAKIAMEYLFPIPSPYEIIDYSLINLSFNIVYSMDKIIKEYEDKSSNVIIIKELNSFEVIILLIIIIFVLKYNYKNSYNDLF